MENRILSLVKENWKNGLLISLFLWTMIWAGYNANFWRVFAPSFPTSLVDFFQGIRSFFPIVAGILALAFIFLKRNSLPKKFFVTPLGLLFLYAIVGIFSSAFSISMLWALYWALMFGSVLVVLLFFLIGSNAQEKISFVINFNWLVAGLLTIALAAFFVNQVGLSTSLSPHFLICEQRPFEGLGGLVAELKTLGMAGTRPTGFGRYAGVISIICLAVFCFDKKRARFLWLVLFFLFFAILVFSRGRTEMAGFLLAVVIIFLVSKKYKFLLAFILLLAILLGAFYFSFKPICSEQRDGSGVTGNITLGDSAKVNPLSYFTVSTNPLTLSGRTTGVWPQAWNLFLSSPLVGYGFQADRFFLEGQHAHNSFLHSLVQTGVLGAIPFVLAHLFTLISLIKLLRNRDVQEEERNFLIIILGVFAFFGMRSITESVAFYGADWIFVAPMIAYVQLANSKYGQKSENRSSVLKISGNKVDLLKIDEVVEKINFWIKNERSKNHWIVVTGMHGIVESNKNPEFKKMLNSSDIFVPDGISLVWLGQLKGFNIKKRVSGADLLKRIFELSKKEEYKNFLYGDTNDTLKALSEKFPDVKINFFSPPFRELSEEEDKEIVSRINQAQPDILWVGLGMPKQEKWIYNHKEKLSVPVVIGVGAAFKFLSGKVKRAPRWIGDLGFEWLWRLVLEPKLIWKRVFIDGPVFLSIVVKDLFFC
jgi:N-acetylglucosaminyldiphosphoundecaprenol N-acetyl-beta-D-mannosaminyltransferase